MVFLESIVTLRTGLVSLASPAQNKNSQPFEAMAVSVTTALLA